MSKSVVKVLFVAGIIEILVGLLHFFMPLFFDKSESFLNLPSIEMDYILLATYAVGILLIAFGSTTILLSKRYKELENIIYYYVMIQTILWAVRVILELLYPVRLEMFYLKPFSLIVLPGLIFELALFIYIFTKLRKKS